MSCTEAAPGSRGASASWVRLGRGKIDGHLQCGLVERNSVDAEM